MKAISLVMPCWLRNKKLCDLTIATFESLKKSKGYKTIKEIVVIDNGSPMGKEILEKYASVVIRNKKNLGYPTAINQGIKLSDSELIAIANNDIRVSPNWLKIAREVFNKAPGDVGSLHYRMIDYDQPIKLGNKTWLQGRERWCNGSFFVIKHSVFEKVGLYDEDYGMGGYDDWDFQHRMRHVCKYKTAFTVEACFQHKHSSTLTTIKDRGKRDQANREKFKTKFGAYAEDIWRVFYSDQMREDYYKFLRECVK